MGSIIRFQRNSRCDCDFNVTFLTIGNRVELEIRRHVKIAADHSITSSENKIDPGLVVGEAPFADQVEAVV